MNCAVQNLTNNHVQEVDGSAGQPALLMVHGTADLTVPYANAKAVFDRAQSVGLQSKLITIPGAGHVPFQQLFNDGTYFDEFMTFVVSALKLNNAECPSALGSTIVV